MRWPKITLLLLPLLIASTTADWSWGADENDKSSNKAIEKPTELLQGETLPEAEEKNFESKSGSVDDIVEELVNNKQGRSLRGDIGDVYEDPTIKEALDAGDDAEARNLIKGRLCNLGLIQCEGDDEETEEKRFLSPDELIYAQPVDIKPIGKPVASIAVRGPPRSYGPPKPMHYPSRPVKGPPKRPYGGNPRPGFSEKYGVAGGNFQFSQSSNGNNYGSYDGNFVTKPPTFANEGPYAYDNSKPNYNKAPLSSGTKTEVVQQHVHHHYVHGDADKEPKIIIKPVAIPVGSVGHLASQNFNAQQSSDIITASGGDFSVSSGGFKPMSAPVYEPDTVYGSQYGHNGHKKTGSSVLTQSLPNQYQNNAFEDQKYGNSLGAYGTQNSEFYKKELYVGSGNNFNQAAGNLHKQGSGNLYNQGSENAYNQGSGNAYSQGSLNSLYNQGPATFGQSNNYQENYHSAKAQGFECVCVNYDQCPAQEVIGRRDDLYLPIDPRNKGSEITALTEEQLDNLNATEVTITENQNSTESDVKKISKREVEAEEAEVKKEAEPRLIGLSGYGGNGGHGGDKKVQPTFGVSFGLPQPSHSGYPINPFNANPIHNPYGPALNGGGLNLGLVSVNPLLAVQVTKNDYGEKVVKPFVNLHVTPNEHVVNKIGHLFHEKKTYLLNKHEHFHHHKPYYPHSSHGHFPSYPPFHHYGPPPSLHQHSHFRPPVYSPHFSQYEPAFAQPYHFRENPPTDEEYYDDDDTNHFDDNNDFNNPLVDHNNYGFERSANASTSNQNNYADRFAYSRSLTLPSKPGANRGAQTIRFPDSRRKRETSVETPTETIEERQGYFNQPSIQQCRPNQVCCRRPLAPQAANRGQCGLRQAQGINGRIKTPEYVDGESEFGEYPWQVAILKKDPKESVYVCGGTLIDGLHIITAAHCIKSHKGFDLRVRLGEWDVNRDVEFYPYVERDIVSVHVHPLYYAGTLDNDLAILKMDRPVEWTKTPHISPACLPDKYTEYAGQRCWTTGWGKDAFGQGGKYQNILKEVDVPVISHGICQQQLKQTRLGYNYELNPGFICAGGEEGKDACKGDGGGPLVCERGGTWQLVGVVSWGIGCGEVGVPGVYVKVAHYLDWISQVTGKFGSY